MPSGYLAILLHGHLPYVRHPEHADYLEERWLYESITECYIPLLMKLMALAGESIPFRLNMTLSPTLVHMLRYDLLRERYIRHLMSLEELAEAEIRRNDGQGHMRYLAKFYRERFGRIHGFWDEWSGDLVAAFSSLEEKGYIEILTCAATHGYLPILAAQPESVRAQIATAVRHHIREFGRAPRGIWLPECGYYPGLEEELARFGLRFFVLDTHSIMNATVRPRFGIYAPVYTPSGVAAFGRDPESSKQVWSARTGYPGDFWYRDFYRDVGFDLPVDQLGAVAHPDGIRTYTGIKYHRITHSEGMDNKDLYYPFEARERAAEHAGNFMFNRQHQVRWLQGQMDRPPIIVAPYDTELFGHWWFEGPDFLDFLFRKIHFDQDEIKPVTLAKYLTLHPRNQVTIPAGGSWGANGYHWVWLDGANSWIYRHLLEAGQAMIDLAGAHPDSGGLERRALNQAARELLLAQSSDWPFMMMTRQSVDFARNRVKVHLARFNRIRREIAAGRIDEGWLGDLEWRDNVFPEADYRIYGGE
jgi:1,4-alpha-glucan branching enzyme